jgi:hypothetical protein
MVGICEVRQHCELCIVQVTQMVSRLGAERITRERQDGQHVDVFFVRHKPHTRPTLLERKQGQNFVQNGDL